METTQRRVAPGWAPPPPVSVEQSQEEDFEATLGSLVDYYSTLPPGALEATVKPQVAAPDRAAAQRRSALRARATGEGTALVDARQRPTSQLRVVGWVCAGAGAMLLGGVVTFAIIAGPERFLGMFGSDDGAPAAAQPEAPPPPKVTVKLPEVPATPAVESRAGLTKGVPRAEPLADEPGMASQQRAMPGVGLATEANAAVETRDGRRARRTPVRVRVRTSSPPVARDTPKNKQKTNSLRPAIPAPAPAAPEGAAGRRQAAKATPPNKAAPASNEPAGDWEDPYE